ncbi:mucin-17-like [Cydia splendana]|uniref:mucin-17-like n=1 Tax=Cydia splendana TaxID=1100963 RepID=UPI00300CCA67
MTRRKSVCSKWTLVLLVVILCQFVDSRPQEVTSPTPANDASTNNVQTTESTRSSSEKTPQNATKEEVTTSSASRNVKTKGAGIGDSIKMVASQLLENPSNSSGPVPIVPDTRIPPKLKNQLAQKHKIKTRHENGEEPLENAHVGVAVPITMEELESENKVNEPSNESSTSNEGISTWILLSNPPNKENITSTTEPTKADDSIKKQKPLPSKNKTKRPQVNKVPVVKRPIIGSTNKSDLVAGGSAINENVYNKIKDTVLSNVQKNKSTTTQRTTTPSTTTVATTTEPPTTKKEIVTKPTVTLPVVKVTSKPTKKKNKNKHKLTTTEAPVVNESALLPMEPKEQEIELEISTPAATTKKPKRTSTKKKKTKKRKTTKPKPETSTAVSEVKTSNKTKSSKPSKKPTITDVTGPITSQIYSYFSREVMPSVGVGVIGLASLVGIASYFLYPFATPVRRTFEVDKKDDIYKHNAEEYANDGNGQAEEEMLGTVLAGMPAHSKHKLNPYAGQTTNVNRNPYPVKKDQDLRYRHVSTSNYEPNYNVRYPQQKTGIAHGAVYSDPINYSPQQPQYETRHVYTTESKYTYDKGPTAYTPSYPAVEPIYAAPQTGPSEISSYGSDSSNAVVYGVKPSSESDFKPVYPFEGQYYGEHQTTSTPMAYAPTSMYLGSNNEEQPEDTKYDENTSEDEDSVDNKFVVGNVPKELSDSVTPAVVPEHGPRNLNRKKRSPVYQKRSITGSIEEILKAAKEQNKDVFLSNEIDEALGLTVKNVPVPTEPIKVETENKTAEIKEEIVPVYAVSVDPTEGTKTTTNVPVTTEKSDFIVESVSTLPINGNKQEPTTETDMSNELDVTTKAFRVYEVFSSNSPADTTEPTDTNEAKTETTTAKSLMTETTTEFKSETTSTMPSTSPVSETKAPAPVPSTSRPRPTMYPEVITYPPLNQEGGIFTFLKRLIEFKYRLGLSIIQNTSESLNRYLRSMENAAQSVANASKT